MKKLNETKSLIKKQIHTLSLIKNKRSELRNQQKFKKFFQQI